MKKLPKILIIGRQNVGKSTLFNKIINKRQAIVNDTPGLTRDYISQIIKINDYYYDLIDTGGLTDTEDKIESLVKKQVLNLFNQINLVIFIVEKNGLFPLDFEIAELIRKTNKPVILLVNKIDTISQINKTELLSEFYELGFPTVIPFSAEHKLNMAQLYDTINTMIKEKITNLKDIAQEIKVAILGKPNVGKSSIINKLTNSQRVIVTEIPGTTRDSIDVKLRYNNQLFNFIDTAGIRKKSKITSDIEYYSINRAVKAIQRADVVLMVLSVETLLSDPDKKIFKFIVDENRPCIILVNKWDLADKKKDNIHNEMTRKIKDKFPLISYVPIHLVSALNGHNIQKIFNYILSIWENYNRTIQTARFNDFVQETVNKNSPPQSGGHIKIYYGTQIKSRPPFFAFFTNHPEKIKENYKNFLINRIRETFNFSGSPIILKFRKK